MELREPLSQRIFFWKKRLFFYCNRQPKQLIWVGLHTLPTDGLMVHRVPVSFLT